jgi:hypothetical protein
MPVDPIVLADDLCERLERDDCAPEAVAEVLLDAAGSGSLTAVFTALITAGRYERLCDVLAPDGVSDSPALRALAAARPSYDHERLNRPALEAARGRTSDAPHDVLIIPGFTPLDAREPVQVAQVPAACRRLEQAYRDYQEGLAPLIIVSGGAVHPPGTPHNEGLMMRGHLLEAGLPESAILVDPYARHSTTNLRNAGRLMLGLGLKRALIVTGFDRPAFSQAFYFAHPTLSSFHGRCRGELGYHVGDLDAVDDNHAAFQPSPAVHTPNYRDPLDW